MVQAVLYGKEDLFFLSPAPVGRLSTLRTQRKLILSDSLTCRRLPIFNGPAMARHGGQIRQTITLHQTAAFSLVQG
jgi:hypothetical protein